MKNVVLLTVRNINIVFLMILIAAQVLLSKASCTYCAVQIVFGADVFIQGTGVVWSPDLFIYFFFHLSFRSKESSNLESSRNASESTLDSGSSVAFVYRGCGFLCGTDLVVTNGPFLGGCR